MQNLRHIDFGIRHCGTTVGDVDLPPWAENHSDFVEKLSQAMESDYVSRYVHFLYFLSFFCLLTAFTYLVYVYEF